MTKTQLNKNAKRALTAYNVSRETRLEDCYKSYSFAKQKAYNYCIQQMESVNGWSFRIISHNVNIFTCGYLYADCETGVIMFRYITPSYETSIEYAI